MDINSVKQYLGSDWEDVQKCIADTLKSEINLLNIANQSILNNSGKQIRPLLTILMARACSTQNHLVAYDIAGDNKRRIPSSAIRYAAAAEILHNATLLHDDVADESDCRRGVPTIRAMMGSSVSVLLGDYWLARASDLILRDATLDLKVLNLFVKTIKDLSEGELLQLEKANNLDTTEADYLKIIYCKTASLFEASVVSGVYSVFQTGGTVEQGKNILGVEQSKDVLGANKAEEQSSKQTYVKAAKEYALALGYAFQIKDDILDYSGTETVGKPLGVDVTERKITLPLLGAFLNNPQREVEIRAKLTEIANKPEIRNEIIDYVRQNNGLDYANRRLGEYVDAAVGSLSVLPDSYEKEILTKLAYFIAKRSF